MSVFNSATLRAGEAIAKTTGYGTFTSFIYQLYSEAGVEPPGWLLRQPSHASLMVACHLTGLTLGMTAGSGELYKIFRSNAASVRTRWSGSGPDIWSRQFISDLSDAYVSEFLDLVTDVLDEMLALGARFDVKPFMPGWNDVMEAYWNDPQHGKKALTLAICRRDGLGEFEDEDGNKFRAQDIALRKAQAFIDQYNKATPHQRAMLSPEVGLGSELERQKRAKEQEEKQRLLEEADRLRRAEAERELRLAHELDLVVGAAGEGTW